jgi:hypothetical protein
MFKTFKDTAGKVVGSLSETLVSQGEQFLKSMDEIEGEFRYYAYLYACEVMRLYSSGLTTYKKLEMQPEELIVTISPEEPVYMEENY